MAGWPLSVGFFDVRFHVPTRRDVEARTFLGAAIFGVGWGIAGYCPGPGLVSAAGGAAAPVAFVIAMATGMLLEHAALRRRTSHAAAVTER